MPDEPLGTAPIEPVSAPAQPPVVAPPAATETSPPVQQSPPPYRAKVFGEERDFAPDDVQAALEIAHSYNDRAAALRHEREQFAQERSTWQAQQRNAPPANAAPEAPRPFELPPDVQNELAALGPASQKFITDLARQYQEANTRIEQVTTPLEEMQGQYWDTKIQQARSEQYIPKFPEFKDNRLWQDFTRDVEDAQRSGRSFDPMQLASERVAYAKSLRFQGVREAAVKTAPAPGVAKPAGADVRPTANPPTRDGKFDDDKWFRDKTASLRAQQGGQT